MDIGALVDRLIKHGVPAGEATDIITKAFTAGVASVPARKGPAKGVQMTIEGTAPAKKATRIPPDFKPDLDYATSQGIPAAVARRESEMFRNYWSAKAGKDATKLDWPATWRSWCLRVADRLGCVPRGAPSQSPAAVDPRKMTEEQWKPILAIYEKTSNWNPLYGPEPGLPGSLAPAQRAML